MKILLIIICRSCDCRSSGCRSSGCRSSGCRSSGCRSSDPYPLKSKNVRIQMYLKIRKFFFLIIYWIYLSTKLSRLNKIFTNQLENYNLKYEFSKRIEKFWDHVKFNVWKLICFVYFTYFQNNFLLLVLFCFILFQSLSVLSKDWINY